jgi:hypothetical protein
MENTKDTIETEALVIDGEDSTPKKPHLNEDTANRFANSVRQKLCKNATVEVFATGEQELVINHTGIQMMEDSYDIRGDGCRNERRNGSAFCQDCSDKHKKENESK